MANKCHLTWSPRSESVCSQYKGSLQTCPLLYCSIFLPSFGISVPEACVTNYKWPEILYTNDKCDMWCIYLSSNILLNGWRLSVRFDDRYIGIPIPFIMTSQTIMTRVKHLHCNVGIYITCCSNTYVFPSFYLKNKSINVKCWKKPVLKNWQQLPSGGTHIIILTWTSSVDNLWRLEYCNRADRNITE